MPFRSVCPFAGATAQPGLAFVPYSDVTMSETGCTHLFTCVVHQSGLTVKPQLRGQKSRDLGGAHIPLRSSQAEQGVVIEVSLADSAALLRMVRFPTEGLVCQIWSLNAKGTLLLEVTGGRMVCMVQTEYNLNSSLVCRIWAPYKVHL